MKALSVKQPFAGLIAEGKKTIETRMWETKYRGDLLICSSLKPHDGQVYAEKWCEEYYVLDWWHCKNFISAEWYCRFFGQALAVARLVDCREMKATEYKAACCSWVLGSYAWVLDDIRPVERFPVKGRLRLFDVPDEKIIYLPAETP